MSPSRANPCTFRCVSVSCGLEATACKEPVCRNSSAHVIKTSVQVPLAGRGPHGARSGPPLPSDYRQLHEEAQCTSFTHIPLLFGKVLQGSLLIARGGTPYSVAEHRQGTGLASPFPSCLSFPSSIHTSWIPFRSFRCMSAFWPFLAMFLAESNAVRLVNMLATIQCSTSVNALAWTVASELGTWFECKCSATG